jgi:hypothetical protein
MSDTVTPQSPRTCRLTHEQRRKGGLAAAAKLTLEQRRLGGQRRRDQPSFRTLQQRRGRRGAQTTLQRYGIKVLVEKLAAWRRRRPTSLELFVAEVLESLGIPFEREKVVAVGDTYWCLDFVVPGGSGGQDLVIEPGHQRWHGTVEQTHDGTDHRALDAERYRVLATLGYQRVLTLSDTEIDGTPLYARRRIEAFVQRYRYAWPDEEWPDFAQPRYHQP